MNLTRLILIAYCLNSVMPLFSSIAQPVSNTAFTVVDTETTGINPRTRRIIEIAAIKLRGTNIIESKSWLVYPGANIPASATRINGITDAMVSNKPPFSAIYDEFLAFTSNTILVAHNSKFDMQFIKEEATRCGRQAPPGTFIDSLPICRKCFPDAGSHSLQNMATYLKIVPDGKHRAMVDTSTLANIFIRCLSTLPPDATLTDLVKPAKPADE